MASDYGLGALIGILPTIVVAGVATGIAQGMFAQKPRSTRRKSSRKSRKFHPEYSFDKKQQRFRPSFGDFRNIGF